MQKIHTYLILIYAVLLVSGSLLYTLNLFAAVPKFLFAAGAVLAIVQTFLYALQNRTDDRREARLQHLHFIATLFLGVAAWLMFLDNTSWLPMMLVYVVVAFFLSFRGKKADDNK